MRGACYAYCFVFEYSSDFLVKNHGFVIIICFLKTTAYCDFVRNKQSQSSMLFENQQFSTAFFSNITFWYAWTNEHTPKRRSPMNQLTVVGLSRIVSDAKLSHAQTSMRLHVCVRRPMCSLDGDERCCLSRGKRNVRVCISCVYVVSL